MHIDASAGKAPILQRENSASRGLKSRVEDFESDLDVSRANIEVLQGRAGSRQGKAEAI